MMRARTDFHTPVEEILSSKGRVRIIKILATLGELNISEIARKAELNYTTANQHLVALERAGIIQQKRFGRIRIYKFNRDDSKAQMIKKFLDSWDTDLRY